MTETTQYFLMHRCDDESSQPFPYGTHIYATYMYIYVQYMHIYGNMCDVVFIYVKKCAYIYFVYVALSTYM